MKPVSREPVRLTFLPDNITVTARVGDTILDAALDNGLSLAHECGGNCACTTCHVIVQEGVENLSAMEEAEADRIQTADNLAPTSRLGCQAILRGGEVIVTVVKESDW